MSEPGAHPAGVQADDVALDNRAAAAIQERDAPLSQFPEMTFPAPVPGVVVRPPMTVSGEPSTTTPLSHGSRKLGPSSVEANEVARICVLMARDVSEAPFCALPEITLPVPRLPVKLPMMVLGVGDRRTPLAALPSCARAAGIGADVIARDDVIVKLTAKDCDAIGTIAGDDVSFRGIGKAIVVGANQACPTLSQHASVVVAQSQRAAGVGADVVAFDDIEAIGAQI